MDYTWTILYLAGLVGAYLLGSIPFGVIIGLAKGVDVRQHGSKNIGSANVGRTLGRRYGLLTFVLDAAKGFVPVFVAGFVMNTINHADLEPRMSLAWMSFGAAAFLGHLYPIFLNFKGGKGVATGFGAILAVFPVLSFPAICAIALWAFFVNVTKYIGFSSCLAALSLPIFTVLATPVARLTGIFPALPSDTSGWAPWSVLWPYFAVSCILAVFVVVRHRTNLARMLAGTENRVGQAARSDGAVQDLHQVGTK